MIHGMKRRCHAQTLRSEKDGATTAKSSTSAFLGKLQELQVVWVPWDNCLLKPSEDRGKSHCKKRATHKTTLSYSSANRNCPRSAPLFMEFVMEKPSSNLLFSAELHQGCHYGPNNTQYRNVRGANGRGGNEKFFLQKW